MTKEEIQIIVNQIDANEKGATFGIFQFGGGPEESYIRANREGLLLYAKTLLNAAIDTEKLGQKEKIISLDVEAEYLDESSSSWLHYIELADKKIAAQDNNGKIAGKIMNILLPVGCLAIVIICFMSMIFGLKDFFNWLF